MNPDSELDVSALGVNIRVQARSRELCGLASTIFPPEWIRTAGDPRLTYRLTDGSGGVSLWAGPRLLLQGASEAAAIERLEAHFKVFVAKRTPHHICIHAGAVAWGNTAIVVPGDSCSGKSTLISALLDAGASLYSDEYAAIDERGNVHPFPVRVHLRRDTWGLPAGRHSAEAAGWRKAEAALPVSLIVLAHYVDGSTWNPRVLTAGEAILELLRHTLAARTYPVRSMATLKAVAVRSQVIKSHRSCAKSATKVLLSFVKCCNVS